MRGLKYISQFVAVAVSMSVFAALPACGILQTAPDILLANPDTGQSAPTVLERVTVILHNRTADFASVDITLDDVTVTYPVNPDQILTIRLKCADIFTFAAIQFTDADQQTRTIPVDQQAVKDLQYTCGDVLLINVHDEFPELEVVAIRPADQ